MIKFSYKTIPGKPRRTRLLNKIIDENANKLLGATQNIRKLTDKELKVQVDTTNAFFVKLRSSIKLLTPTEIENIKAYAQVDTFSELRVALNALASALDKAALRAPNGWEHDHLSMEPINQSLSFTILVLVEAIQQMESGKRFKDTKVGGNTAIVNKSTQGLKTLVNQLRGLRALSASIGSSWKSGMSPRSLANMIKGEQGTIDITTLKVKDLSFRDGKKMEISTVLTEDHAVKSAKQKIVGGARQVLLGGKLNITEMSDQVTANFIDQLVDAIRDAGPLNITGSKSLGGATDKNISKAVRGQRTTTKKTTSKTRKQYKVGKVRVPKRIGQYIVRDTAIEVKQAAAALGTKIASSNKSRKRDREGGERQRQLNILRNKINQRLGAQVRRNMGRPALINQTGRFSDSATLLSLVQRGENQILGEYSYLLAPYETFENTGERQWRNSYNPKPLISKSIRELAGEVAEDKFTFYLRRV